MCTGVCIALACVCWCSVQSTKVQEKYPLCSCSFVVERYVWLHGFLTNVFSRHYCGQFASHSLSSSPGLARSLLFQAFSLLSSLSLSPLSLSFSLPLFPLSITVFLVNHSCRSPLWTTTKHRLSYVPSSHPSLWVRLQWHYSTLRLPA